MGDVRNPGQFKEVALRTGFELLAYRRAALCIAEKTEALDLHCLIIVSGRPRMTAFRCGTKESAGRAARLIWIASTGDVSPVTCQSRV